MYKLITDKYKDITPYHSGGGCMHLSLESSIDKYAVQWLINATYNGDDGEPSNDLDDITENARCMFGIHFNDYDVSPSQKEIIDSIDWHYKGGDYFLLIEPFKDGYMIMKDIDNRLTNAPTWEDC